MILHKHLRADHVKIFAVSLAGTKQELCAMRIATYMYKQRGYRQ